MSAAAPAAAAAASATGAASWLADAREESLKRLDEPGGRAPVALSPMAGKEREPPPAPPLTWIASSSYSVGHFLNDATAACWFSYLLLYLEQAQGLTPPQAGLVMLSG